jgi:hypothetical protein
MNSINYLKQIKNIKIQLQFLNKTDKRKINVITCILLLLCIVTFISFNILLLKSITISRMFHIINAFQLSEWKKSWGIDQHRVLSKFC